MIQIEGLSKKQKMFADIIWSFDTQDQVKQFIASLPEKDRKQAQTVCELMILAFIDEVNTIEEETIDLINSFKE
jgi:hypothetical protein